MTTKKFIALSFASGVAAYCVYRAVKKALYPLQVEVELEGQNEENPPVTSSIVELLQGALQKFNVPINKMKESLDLPWDDIGSLWPDLTD